MSKQILHIGIDDTDSPKGMCTTFLAYKIINRLKKENVDFLDFPNLVRFNPNIPWKTRGNGAVGIKISTSNPGKIKNLVKKFDIPAFVLADTTWGTCDLNSNGAKVLGAEILFNIGHTNKLETLSLIHI